MLHNLGRRRLILACLSGLSSTLVVPRAFAQVTSHPSPVTQLPVTSHQSRVTPIASVVPGYRLHFPHDEGSHPEFRIEWWYVTGWLNDATARKLGFQITFFRARPELKHDNPSAFTPRQILIAHAALSDPDRGRLLHDQRAARDGFDLAGAAQDRTHVWIDDWSLEQNNAVYVGRIPARDFRFEFSFTATQPPLLQGEGGLSRKGPRPESASYYYSLPQLKMSGTLTRNGRAEVVTGMAWLDHEWSSSYMDQEAVGWDWVGINLADGGALMAFRMRDKQGGKYWAGGALRQADGTEKVYTPREITFTPLRHWRSPRSGASYPVAVRVKTGDLELTLEPLLDDQENDARVSTGTIYWEGAVRALGDGKAVGHGYLELTGYWRRPEL